jgi:hypothetical protein
MRIHDPDVVVTDLALALLGAVLAWRLARDPRKPFLTSAGITIMVALASAAFFGAVFHAFFPGDTTSRAAFLAWIPVSLSIVVVSGTLLALGLWVLLPQLSRPVRRVLLTGYSIAFAFVVVFVDESYEMIVRFYAPTLVLFLVAALREAIRRRDAGWRLLAIAFAMSIAAAFVQQARIALHPQVFDHNALYHVIQGAALVVLYVGFRRVNEHDPARRAQ